MSKPSAFDPVQQKAQEPVKGAAEGSEASPLLKVRPFAEPKKKVGSEENRDLFGEYVRRRAVAAATEGGGALGSGTDTYGIHGSWLMQPGHDRSRKLVIRRRISEKENVEDQHKKSFNDFLHGLDEAVEKAFSFAIHYPDLKDYAGLDGHTEHWVELWQDYCSKKGGNISLLSAAFGYVVETLATMVYLPAAPDGLNVELQGIRRGTRPDLVLKAAGVDVGWLDITAEGSSGHVWDKTGWLLKTIHRGEVTYPSFDPDVIAYNVANKLQYDDKTDRGEVMNRVKYFKWIQEVRRLHWNDVGQKYFDTPLDSNNQTKKRQYIRGRLAAFLRLDYDKLPPQVLGSVLYAMNVGTGKHGYNGKNKISGISRAKGESMLQQHDPELPGVEAYTPQVMQSLAGADPETLQKILLARFGDSSHEHFNPPSFTYDPSLPDETVVEQGSQGDITVVGIAKRYSSFLGQTVTLDYSTLVSMARRMQREMRELAVKSFGIKVKLGDGTVTTIRMDKTPWLRTWLLRQQTQDESRKKARNQIISEKRLRGMQDLDQRSQIVPRPLSMTQIEFQILAIGVVMQNGTQVVVDSNTTKPDDRASSSTQMQIE